MVNVENLDNLLKEIEQKGKKDISYVTQLMGLIHSIFSYIFVAGQKQLYMKYLLVSLGFLFLLSGCMVQYTQLYEVKSDLNRDNTTVFENDTVRIQYYFWEKAGVLAFTIENKLNIPIYIDWKKSSFIKNGDKFDYWVDEQTGQYTTDYTSIQYKGLLSGWDVGQVKVGQAVTSSKTIKPERITFIAPHSKIYRSSFVLYNPLGIKLSVSDEKKQVESKAKPGKTFSMYVESYTKEKSPLLFRNFLTISTTEKFEHETYIDNEFYVDKISEMPSNEFMQPDATYGNYMAGYYNVDLYRYKSDNCFYVHLLNYLSVEGRKSPNKW